MRRALASKVTVITGGPGVGKTTLVNALLRILAAKDVRAALCAPTGRAAKRLSESTGREARTIHRLLEADPRSGGFKRDEATPLEGDLVVVDETSMVDAPFLASLLRAQPPAGAGGEAETLAPHRDTWGSNVMAQINWWTPLYPLARERTLAFYPSSFARPVANDSADWDLEKLRSRRREGAGYPRLPVATEALDAADELRVEIEPGDLLCFSGAHLHASVPNTTDLARFNVETRTVDLDDLRAGRGAPNVDGRAPRVATEWFRRLANGEPLTEALDRGG